MSESFTVQAFASKGEKPNPHGGTLYKWEVSLRDEKGETHHKVYWQSKSDALHEGQEVYGEITEGDYGPRFRTAQREDGSGNQGNKGGNFQRPNYQREGMTKDDYWTAKNERDVESQARMGRAHAQEMALRWVFMLQQSDTALPRVTTETLVPIIDWFHDDVQRFPLDADVGGGDKRPGGTDPAHTSRGAGNEAAADVSADRTIDDMTPEEIERVKQGAKMTLTPKSDEPAPPTLKARATHLMNQAGLAKGARQAVIMFRCGTLKDPPKDKLMALVKDLEEGANAEYLLAEVSAARAAGNPLGARAAAMIPTDVPNAEPLPEEAKDGEDIPF